MVLCKRWVPYKQIELRNDATRIVKKLTFFFLVINAIHVANNENRGVRQVK